MLRMDKEYSKRRDQYLLLTLGEPLVLSVHGVLKCYIRTWSKIYPTLQRQTEWRTPDSSPKGSRTSGHPAYIKQNGLSIPAGPVTLLIAHWCSVPQRLQQGCSPASVKQNSSCDRENAEHFPRWCYALSQLFFSWVTVLWPALTLLFFKKFLCMFSLLVSSVSFLSVKIQLWQWPWKASPPVFFFWSKAASPDHRGTRSAFLYGTVIVWVHDTPCSSKLLQPAALVLLYLALYNFGFG